jgi:hypothetical protein
MDKKHFFQTKKTETDSTKMPDKILNGSIYVELSKI